MSTGSNVEKTPPTTRGAGNRLRNRPHNPKTRRHRKTRNRMLLLVSCFVIAYTLFDMALGWAAARDGNAIQLDSTLTTEVFSFAKWVVASGAGITVAKTLKGDTNSDETETHINTPEG